jgi:predicted DCC family thiol-disulfide oxidoreductase YuxK
MPATQPAQPRDVLFYDGECGLCHGYVRFLVRRDPSGDFFRFSPLQGRLLATLLNKSERAALPDSLVLRTADGVLLMRSAAVLATLERLGGFWRGVARVVRIVPRPLRDFCYEVMARLRRRLFPRPPDLCPLMPPHLRGRFED